MSGSGELHPDQQLLNFCFKTSTQGGNNGRAEMRPVRQMIASEMINSLT